jgi:general secretion pathway protein K
MHTRITTRPGPPQSAQRQQRGVALLTALLIVSLATIIAVNMTERQQYDIRRVENLLHSEQGYYYALGGEAWARSVLYRDFKSASHKATDNLFEDWAQPLPATIIEGGTISGQIFDLQARFNLNNLYLEDRRDPGAVNRHKEQIRFFESLLTTLDIKENVTQALIDWMDTDSDISFPNGAEDQTYAEKAPPYRTSNQPMSSPSELMLVEGVTSEMYAKLKPFVCALPENTTININTAPAVIIAALSAQIDLEKATEIVEERTEVFDKNKEFIDTTNTHAADKKKYELEITPLIGVSSQYFQVQAQVEMGNVTHNLRSNLKRNADSSIEVISRSPGID